MINHVLGDDRRVDNAISEGITAQLNGAEQSRVIGIADGAHQITGRLGAEVIFNRFCPSTTGAQLGKHGFD